MQTMWSTIIYCSLFFTCRFIPGTSASDIHYQAYLIDGITRWNKDRASAFLAVSTQSPRTFDIALQQKVITNITIDTYLSLTMFNLLCYRSILSVRRSLEGQCCQHAPLPTSTLVNFSVFSICTHRVEMSFQQWLTRKWKEMKASVKIMKSCKNILVHWKALEYLD